MKKTIQFTALCASITLASITVASASLTEEASNLLLGIDQSEAVTLSVQFDNVGDMLTQVDGLARTIVAVPSGDISDDITTVSDKIGGIGAVLDTDIDTLNGTIVNGGNTTTTARMTVVSGKIGGVGAVLDTDIDAVKAKVLIVPTAVLDTDVSTMRTKLGTAAQFLRMRGVVNGLTPAAGNAGEFTDGTTGTAVPATLGTLNGVSGSIENYDRTLRRIAFNILSTGVVGNQNGIVTADAADEDSITWCQIIEALATIADHA